MRVAIRAHVAVRTVGCVHDFGRGDMYTMFAENTYELGLPNLLILKKAGHRSGQFESPCVVLLCLLVSLEILYKLIEDGMKEGDRYCRCRGWGRLQRKRPGAAAAEV